MPVVRIIETIAPRVKRGVVFAGPTDADFWSYEIGLEFAAEIEQEQ